MSTRNVVTESGLRREPAGARPFHAAQEFVAVQPGVDRPEHDQTEQGRNAVKSMSIPCGMNEYEAVAKSRAIGGRSGRWRAP